MAEEDAAVCYSRFVSPLEGIMCTMSNRRTCVRHRGTNSVERWTDISAGVRCTLWSVHSRRGGWRKTHSLKCRNQNRLVLHQLWTFKGTVNFSPRMFSRMMHRRSFQRRIWSAQSDPHKAFCSPAKRKAVRWLWNKPHHNTASVTQQEGGKNRCRAFIMALFFSRSIL